MASLPPPAPDAQQAPLFDGYEPPERPEGPELSADQRRTRRQADDIARGIHPLAKTPIHPLASRHRDAASPKRDPFTCGSCYFREIVTWHNRSYAKCVLPNPSAGADAPPSAIYTRATHSAASDVRAWWPACRDYSPGDNLSPDAARSIPDPEVDA